MDFANFASYHITLKSTEFYTTANRLQELHQTTVRKTFDMDIMASHDMDSFDYLPVRGKCPTADSDLAGRIIP